MTVGTSATITVTCTADGRADSSQIVELAGVASDCDDPLGSVIHGVTVRDGTIAADAGCVSAGRGLGGTFYARRHTFTLDAAARVTVDVSGEAGVDAYVVLYRGHDAAAAAVLRRDDNSGPSSDPRLRGVRLAAGDYTVEATTAQAQATGGYRVTVSAAYVSPVRISGLADAAGAGTGAVTVTEPFTVTPAAAACTASPPAASVAAGSGRRRAVSVTLDRPGSLRVTVTCTAARRGPAAADLTLTHAGALTSIAARITAGGECTATRAPRRFDAAYRCTIGRANTVTVAADTTATGPAVDTAWDTTGGITASKQSPGTATPAFGPDNRVTGWQRTATAQLECTANGTATATASLPGTTANKTARLTITCADAVHIDSLADTTANGTGTLTVTSSFTVTPADAACIADPTAATVTAGVGGARTLTASIAVPGTLAVTVTCKAAGRADGVRNVNLTAARPCSTHLGTLATGTVARSGTIADDGCVAQARLPRTATVFYAARRAHWAKRHTFALKTPGWVTVSINNSPANAEPLDTYAVLLKDDNNKGTVIARNDNASRRSTDARLTDLFLQPGSYTIEATTRKPQATGNYTLTINATVTGLQASYDATVGRELRIDFDLGKFQAAATASHADLAVTAQRTGTTGTLLLVPDSTNPRTVTVSFSDADASSGAAQGAAQRSPEPETAQSAETAHTISLSAVCGDDQTEDPETGACIWDEVELRGARGDRYAVTKALLDGVYRVANRAVNAYEGECDMTPTQLAALMLAIGIYETNPVGSRSVARSLMTVSRVDRPNKAYPNNNPEAARIAGSRAFWHPGVGYWQLDYWPNELNHAERADVDLGGRVVVEYLLDEYCKPDGGEANLRRRLYTASWNGCRPIVTNAGGVQKRHSDGTPIRVCYNAYRQIYLGGDLGDSTYKGVEGLWATASGNGSLTNTKGGVQPLWCRWNDSADWFRCWLYDTDNPEGNISDDYPRGVWFYDPGDPDTSPPAGYPDGVWTANRAHRRSPLAAPFVSFTHSGKRFAVFPESFAGGSVTWFKYVSIGSGADFRVRTAPGNSWHREDYDVDADGTDDVLMVQDQSSVIVIQGESQHPWVDVADAGFKTIMRRRYP